MVTHYPRRTLTKILSVAVLLLSAVLMPLSALAETPKPGDVFGNKGLDTVVTSDGLTYSASEMPVGKTFQESLAGSGQGKGNDTLSGADAELRPLGSAYPESVIGPDGRTRVYTTTTYPYRAIAYLAVTFPGGSGGCTGWFIGPRTVATAGHCVYNSGYGGWASSITVYPGRNGSSIPYGSTTSHRLFSVTGWTQNGNPNYDYGAIQTNTTLGNTVGWFGFRWQSSNTFAGAYTVTGYPGDKTTGTMWTMAGGINYVTTYRLWYQIDTYNGQSGSPFYHNYSSSCNPCSVGFHTYGTGLSPYPAYNSATRITQAAYNNLVNWKNYTYP